MPYSEEFGLTVHGTGKSNREVVLNEIKEMMKEVNGLANSLRALEALVLSRPDTGVLKVRPATPLLTPPDLVVMVNWILSIYESFYCIATWGVSSEKTKQFADKFAETIRKPHSVQVSVPK